MLAADLGGRKAGLLLLDHPNNLRLGETALLLHMIEQTLHQNAGPCAVQVNPEWRMTTDFDPDFCVGQRDVQKARSGSDFRCFVV
ncbi:hypothetical protein EDC90_10452 [Martelella mediterranea]|uniref:Uncharacterized protein n=1 Tax=Martelella mediterranea TaxID=293089 RepID=A0A4R3NGP4_9HYPH|nr:hypothetical protein EDC90_10452 [Martelella mediterranea]